MLFQTNELVSKNPSAYNKNPGAAHLGSQVAKMMPSRNVSVGEVRPLNMIEHTGTLNEHNFYGSRANKRQAASTISAEAYLSSRISMRPVYIHNEMLTRMQNISNLLRNPPRFKDQVDLTA